MKENFLRCAKSLRHKTSVGVRAHVEHREEQCDSGEVSKQTHPLEALPSQPTAKQISASESARAPPTTVRCDLLECEVGKRKLHYLICGIAYWRGLSFC